MSIPRNAPVSEAPDAGSVPAIAATPGQRLTLIVPQWALGRRLDQALAELLADCSRSAVQDWLRAGHVRVDDRVPRQRDRLAGGERVEIDVPVRAPVDSVAEAIALDVVHRDEDLLVINKPAGMVVHPGAGNPTGTLLNAVLHLEPRQAALPRAGIVHRLDKDTSGLLVLASTEKARQSLIDDLKRHTVERRYLAVACGTPIAGGTVDAPLGRHPRDRLRMAVTARGRPAISHYRVQERFRGHTLLRVDLETGRTHQIRVHLAHIRLPLLGDALYGGRRRLPAGASPDLVTALQGFHRQALHAWQLRLTHPRSGALLAWQAPLPADLAHLLATLRADLQSHASV